MVIYLIMKTKMELNTYSITIKKGKRLIYHVVAEDTEGSKQELTMTTD